MADYGLTPEGFEKKRLDDIVEDIQDNFKNVYGSNFNVEPETKQGQIIGNIAAALSSLWDIGEESFNYFNPSAATQKGLSDLVQYNGLIRQEATSSQVELTITGINGTVVPAGSQVEVEGTGERFETVTTVLIPVSGSTTVAALSLNTGPIVGAAGTINIIFTPITGWQAVDNALAATLGLEEESDEELRARRNNSVAVNAINIVDAAAAQLQTLDNVINVLVLENDTNIPDANLVPPHSGEAIVQGGDPAEIGAVLLRNKIPGIPWVGGTNVPINDSQGVPRDINYTIPTDIVIDVAVNLNVDADYPANGDDLIKQNIVDYANGLLVAGRGFSVGDNVILSELYTPVNFVPGHSVISILIAIQPGAVGSANIPIDIRESSFFDVANIVVNS